MSGINWKKDAERRRMQRQGVEDKAGPSKDALRREADRLLAGYTGSVERVPAGVTGNISSENSAVRSKRKVDGVTSKDRKSKRRRQSGNLFGTSPTKSRMAAQIDRAVPTGLVIYCDGACEPNPGAGGWGFAVFRDGVEIHSDCGGSVATTNNIMEMTGALMALRWLSEQGIVEPVRILCDSRYTVDGCNAWRLAWKARGWKRKGKNPEIANLDLWKELDDALRAVPIRLEWVKGHAGIIGNERADELSLIGREAALEAEADDCGDLIAEQLRYEVV